MLVASVGERAGGVGPGTRQREGGGIGEFGMSAVLDEHEGGFDQGNG